MSRSARSAAPCRRSISRFTELGERNVTRLVLLAFGMLLAAGSVLAQPAPDALSRIKAAKTINVGYSTDSPPFSFVGPDKQPVGFSIDLCNRVIAAVGRAVNNPELK